MTLFDTHMHTDFSFDSREKLENILKRSKELGIGVITTEHKDLNYMDVGGFPIDFNVMIISKLMKNIEVTLILWVLS